MNHYILFYLELGILNTLELKVDSTVSAINESHMQPWIGSCACLQSLVCCDWDGRLIGHGFLSAITCCPLPTKGLKWLHCPYEIPTCKIPESISQPTYHFIGRFNYIFIVSLIDPMKSMLTIPHFVVLFVVFW